MTELKDIPSFQTTEEVLVYLSKALSNLLNLAEPNPDSGSDFMRLNATLQKVLRARAKLAAARLKQIDQAIADSGIIDQIDAAAADAKKEADRIKRATKVVNDIVGFVDEITKSVGLVGKILSL